MAGFFKVFEISPNQNLIKRKMCGVVWVREGSKEGEGEGCN
jgi:hypothetical protein